MDERKRFKFSLANLFWMMLPLAVVCAAIGSGSFFPVLFALVLGLPAAVGALRGGWKGMLRTAAVFFAASMGAVVLWLATALIFVLIVRIIDFLFSTKYSGW